MAREEIEANARFREAIRGKVGSAHLRTSVDPYFLHVKLYVAFSDWDVPGDVRGHTLEVPNWVWDYNLGFVEMDGWDRSNERDLYAWARYWLDTLAEDLGIEPVVLDETMLAQVMAGMLKLYDDVRLIAGVTETYR